MDQLRDLIGLHCTSGRVENNGVVLLLFFIRLMIRIQVYASQETRVGPGHPPESTSDVTRLFFSSSIPRLFFTQVPLKNMFLSSSVCARVCPRKKSLI